MDFLSSTSPHQLESVYPTSCHFFPSSVAGNKMSQLKVPLRYLSILFMVARWDSFGLCINLLTIPTLYDRSGLVWQRYLNDPISILYYVGSTSYVFGSFVIYNLVSVDVEVALHSSISNLLSISLAYLLWCSINPLLLLYNLMPMKNELLSRSYILNSLLRSLLKSFISFLQLPVIIDHQHRDIL